MLGLTATDKITGFTGVVTARAEFLYGPTRYEVSPQALHKGQPVKGEWLDEARLDVGKKVIEFYASPPAAGLGDTLKDKLTGFKGIATACFTFLNGCQRYELSPPKLKDGKPEEPLVVDAQQIIVVKKVKLLRMASPSTEDAALLKKPPGGPHDGPTPYRTPAR